mgnify:CR=1 FL=1
MVSDEAVKVSNTSLPGFKEPVESLIERVRLLVGKVDVPRGLARPHQVIARLLEEDERRIEEQKGSDFPRSWNNPMFDSPIE